MRVLHLTVTRRWFDLIASGIKKEEYRTRKPYWTKRLVGKTYDEVHFRNGYSQTSPWLRAEWKGMIDDDKNDVYTTLLGKILEIKDNKVTPGRWMGEKSKGKDRFGKHEKEFIKGTRHG